MHGDKEVVLVRSIYNLAVMCQLLSSYGHRGGCDLYTPKMNQSEIYQAYGSFSSNIVHLLRIYQVKKPIQRLGNAVVA